MQSVLQHRMEIEWVRILQKQDGVVHTGDTGRMENLEEDGKGRV
jgi:hypothetical protein